MSDAGPGIVATGPGPGVAVAAAMAGQRDEALRERGRRLVNNHPWRAR